MEHTRKIAVVLFNLGGPDRRDAIAPFLYNFFSDPNIIRLPGVLRRLVARRIASKRAKNEAGSSYARLDYKSPLLANTLMQAEALQEELHRGGISGQNRENRWRVFVCMRYWRPMADEIAEEVRSYGPDHIVLLPLYPQYSTTTTRSSLQDWDRAARLCGLSAVPQSTVCCYPEDEGFVQASAESIFSVYRDLEAKSGRAPRILLSAHGLPCSVIRDGDPYQWQCERTASAIVDALPLDAPDWQICYQSRVGPMKWIGPSTEEALSKAAADGVPVVVYPHAFVSEHVETIVEIGEEYRNLAQDLGIPGFVVAQTAGTHPAFISGLGRLVHKALEMPGILQSGCCARAEGGSFSRCCAKDPKMCKQRTK